MNWHYQTTPGDNWDYTAVQDMALAEMTIDGEPAQGAAAGAEERLLLRHRPRRRHPAARPSVRHRDLGLPCGLGNRATRREPGNGLSGAQRLGAARPAGRAQLAGNVSGRGGGLGLHPRPGQPLPVHHAGCPPGHRPVQAQPQRLELGRRNRPRRPIGGDQLGHPTQAGRLPQRLRPADWREQVGGGAPALLERRRPRQRRWFGVPRRCLGHAHRLRQGHRRCAVAIQYPTPPCWPRPSPTRSTASNT